MEVNLPSCIVRFEEIDDAASEHLLHRPGGVKIAVAFDMSNTQKLLDQVLRGSADASVPFSGLVHLLKRLGLKSGLKEVTISSPPRSCVRTPSQQRAELFSSKARAIQLRA